MFLVLQGSICDPALLMDEYGLGQRMPGLALVESGLTALAQLGAFQPIQREQGALDPPHLGEGEIQPVLAFECGELFEHHGGCDGASLD